ncbi:MAG TPA: ribosomal protein S18-alanine N-acetyltransferase [Acidimicrobiia bacterium]
MGVDMITIRPLAVDDVAAAAAMEATHQPAPWPESVFRDELAAPSRIYLAAEASGELVGFAGALLVADEAHVTNILVALSHRRMGIGRKLMLTLIDEAVDAGARHLTLEVRTRNEAARALYASLGMVPVGVRPRYYGDDDALIMWAHDIDSPEYLARLGVNR